jgi:hypothetical protein
MSEVKQSVTFQDFIKKWETQMLPHKPPYIRKGQALMIFLYKEWPEEYKRISSVHYYNRTDIDCFYNDSIIPNTLKHLEEIWEK